VKAAVLGVTECGVPSDDRIDEMSVEVRRAFLTHDPTYRRYAIVDEAMLREAAARLDAWMQAPQRPRSGVVNPIQRVRRR